MGTSEYGYGDWVMYDPGYTKQIGRVTKCIEGKAFVCYSMGCTAAATPLEYLRPATEDEILVADKSIGFNRFHEFCPSKDDLACPDCRAAKG